MPVKEESKKNQHHHQMMQVRMEMMLTLSKPLLSSLLPRVSPMPASSVTGLSPIGSETKL